MAHCPPPLIVSYLHRYAGVLCFRLDMSGKIIEMNEYAQRLLGDRTGAPFVDFVIDFSSPGDGMNQIDKLVGPGALGAPGAPGVKESILSIATRDGEPRSFLFSASKADWGLWLLGRSDQQEDHTMAKEIYGLNQQLGNMSRELQKKNASLEAALAHIKTLQGILPICMHCHKIRNEKEVWSRLETYIEAHTDAEFSHSICHECLEKYYPQDDEACPDSFDEPNFGN